MTIEEFFSVERFKACGKKHQGLRVRILNGLQNASTRSGFSGELIVNNIKNVPPQCYRNFGLKSQEVMLDMLARSGITLSWDSKAAERLKKFQTAQ